MQNPNPRSVVFKIIRKGQIKSANSDSEQAHANYLTAQEQKLIESNNNDSYKNVLIAPDPH